MNANTPLEDTNKDTSNPSQNDYQKATFWTVTLSKGSPKAQPSWTCIRDKLIEMGFRTYWPSGQYKGTPEFIQVIGNVLHQIEAFGIKNMFVSLHIDTMVGTQVIDLEDGQSVTFQADELKESFLRVFGNNFATPQLHALPPFIGKILRDTRTSAFFLFQDKIIEVQAGSRRELHYSDLGDRFVWQSQIIQRKFNCISHQNVDSPQSCEFEKFLLNITNHTPDRIAAFTSAIGYLLHNFTMQSETKVVWNTDEAVTDKDSPQGRSGKGLFMKAIKQLRNVHYRDGKSYKPTAEFFFQGITLDTQLVWIDDPSELFDFEKLFSVVVEGWVVSRKHRNDLAFTLEDSPKTYIASNQPPTLRGSSNFGRLHVLTSGNFYSKRLDMGTGRPIVDIHGGEFFTEWDENEWTRFYDFMLNCVSSYLKHGLKTYACPSIIQNQLIRQTSSEFTEWTADPCLSNGGKLDDGTERPSTELFENYKSVSGDDKLTARTFNRWMKVFVELNGLKFKDRKSNGKKYFTFSKSA